MGGRRKSVLTDQQYLKIRDATPVEAAVKSEFAAANQLLQNFVRDDTGVGMYIPEELKDAVFCGHLVADLDSIAGAIGGALLYGGHAARASEINSETAWALDYWGYDLKELPMVDDVLKKRGPGAKVCLVDFQQTTQLHAAIPQESIVGIIDHHALQNSTVVIPRPVFVDIRPWGSMSTILAHTYALNGIALPKPVGGLLLGAILSDTLNLRSPTTTEWDKKMVALLVQYCGVDDVNVMCAEQFKAKSKNLAAMSAYSLVSGDIKQFKMGPTPTKVAFAVIETTDPEAMLKRADEFVPEMAVAKTELGVDLIFVAIVDIVKLESHVSRKADFVPPLAEAFDGGWKLDDVPPDDALDVDTVVVVEETPECPGGKFVRRKSMAGGITVPLSLRNVSDMP
ncbi:hypothetical protein JL722_1948 [Aureococcus anophagefferens]|nr:hypothetical protein JL722_1948 [Aureococcus anophagefferens]